MSLKRSVGGRDSDSFCSVAEADSYLADLPDADELWSGLDTAKKEYRLKLAAQLLGYLPFAGYTIYCGQALCFPRRIRGNVACIPNEVKEAQAQIAYSVIHRAIANRPDVTSEDVGQVVSSISLGGLLSVSFAKGPVQGGNVLDQIVRSIQFPIFLGLKKYMSQIRGGSIADTDDDDYPQCSTTTTTCTTTTTTTTSTSTTSTTA